MTNSDLIKIADEANAKILATKKQYAENMCQWLEDYVAKNLISKALGHAKKGHTMFKLCTISRIKTKYVFKILWEFSHYEMQGNFSSKFWYDENEEGERWGSFLDIRSILEKKLTELSTNYGYKLSYEATQVDRRADPQIPNSNIITWAYNVVVRV